MDSSRKTLVPLICGSRHQLHESKLVGFSRCLFKVGYPCIQPTSSISSKATIDLLKDFAHFGYPHTIVSDNAICFTSDEFQTYCKDQNIIHLTGALYHPATNGATERLIQTFKQALRKSSKAPRKVILEFLMQCRRTPTASGYSTSELLNNRHLRAVIDTLLSSLPHITQFKLKSSNDKVNKTYLSTFQYGPCYALFFGSRRNQDPRWIPALIVKRQGSRIFHVRVVPTGPIWRRHLNQLQTTLRFRQRQRHRRCSFHLCGSGTFKRVIHLEGRVISVFIHRRIFTVVCHLC